MSFFELFKQKVREIRSSVEEFKDNHKMASATISKTIENIPPPFNSFLSIVWDGLEKKGEDSSAKLLEILEKIQNNTEQSFSEIKTNISKLIEFVAKPEDIQKLAEQIRISNESTIQILKEEFNKQLEIATTRLEKTFQEDLIELHLLHSRLKLVTRLKKYGKGDKDCWKKATFTNEDIKEGYDARRPIIDDILFRLDNNIGTILYGEPYYGKSTTLKRVMFEEIEKNEFVVLYREGEGEDQITFESNPLIEIIERASHIYPKLLIIADDVHKSGMEIFFDIFNAFAKRLDNNNYQNDKKIRFLFAAYKEELDMVVCGNGLEWKKQQQVETARKNMYEINMTFNKDDAILFLKQALFVENSDLSQLTEQYIENVADRMYEYSDHDPFMFIFALISYLEHGKTETGVDFIENYIFQMIKSFGEQLEDNNIWRTVLFSAFMGTFGMHIQIDEYSKSPSKMILECYNIDEDYLDYLNDKSLLFKKGKEYRLRHVRWMLQFFIYLYSENFYNDLRKLFSEHGYSLQQLIKIKQLLKEGVQQLIPCILNNIEAHGYIDILKKCTFLFNKYEDFKPLCKKIVDNYTVSDNLDERRKADIYCFGLGYFYSNAKGYPDSFEKAMQSYDKALEIDPNYDYAYINKGIAFSKKGRYEDAIKFYDKALEINPINPDAWHNKGVDFSNMRKYEEAVQSYDKAEEISRNNNKYDAL